MRSLFITMGGLFLASMAAIPVHGDENQIYSLKIGAFDVSMLVENSGPGRPNVLIGVTPKQIQEYLNGGNFGSETNTFLVKGNGHTVVIDTGFGGAIFKHLETLGVKPADVDTVLLTHLHGDHIGGLAKDGKALFPKATLRLAKRERDYWLDERKDAGATAAFAPYKGRIETFEPGDLAKGGVEVLPGLRAVAAYGHTPGHTVFLVRDAGKEFIVWGDLMHVEGIQFPLPDISVTYDTDPALAAASRKAVLAYAAANKSLIGGMHLIYPAAGTVEKDGSGYKFVK